MAALEAYECIPKGFKSDTPARHVISIKVPVGQRLVGRAVTYILKADSLMPEDEVAKAGQTLAACAEGL